jgi:hypothetical protein
LRDIDKSVASGEQGSKLACEVALLALMTKTGVAVGAGESRRI